MLGERDRGEGGRILLFGELIFLERNQLERERTETSRIDSYLVGRLVTFGGELR